MRSRIYLGVAVVLAWLLEGMLWIRLGFAFWQGDPWWCDVILLVVAAFVFIVGALAWEMLSRRLPW